MNTKEQPVERSKYPEQYAERLLFRARDCLDTAIPKHLELSKSINQYLHDTDNERPLGIKHTQMQHPKPDALKKIGKALQIARREIQEHNFEYHHITQLDSVDAINEALVLLNAMLQ